jgi:N-acetylglucosaminyldiphosphoundecaprenol N-acetyl-beta-D-mannosaminyltransferase
MIKQIEILDITFSAGNESEIINQFLKDKGYLVCPAASALVEAEENKYFKDCLVNSSLAILDSGMLVILNNFFQKEKFTRLSGLSYLRKAFEILDTSEFEKSLWVLPNEINVEATGRLLKSKKNVGLKYYLAPQYPKYGPIEDPSLLNIITNQSPKHVFIGLGGGTQERLAYLINKNFNKKICIHCIGASISFLNGTQVYIPVLFDKLFLGWLLRCLRNPITYIPRYFKSLKIISLYIRKKK